jgi:2-polyprenyl-6-methoxyphenol hydroxylase-like FAD-dependent oxidoreductase
MTINKVLVIGGGFSGMAAALRCRQHGIHVDLVEKNPAWKAYGAGITIGGATFRALQMLGLLEQFLQHGHGGSGVDLYDDAGNYLTRLETPPPAGADVPGNGAIMRPVLGDIMGEACIAAGVDVRVGCTFTGLHDRGSEVEVDFTDGTHRSYDLVIGADGLLSETRRVLFPDAPLPAFTGQGVWRAVLKRPAWVERTVMWHSERMKMKMGVNPVSDTHMYLFLNDFRPTNDFIPAEQQPGLLRDLLSTFTAPAVLELRDQIGPESQVIYRPLEGILLPLPWHRGRAVLIGDAVHATTPHLAMGAGIGIEDGIVLADELAAGDAVAATLQRFEQRRWERCRLVVENSRRLGEIEKSGTNQQEHAQLMRDSMVALAQPI